MFYKNLLYSILFHIIPFKSGSLALRLSKQEDRQKMTEGSILLMASVKECFSKGAETDDNKSNYHANDLRNEVKTNQSMIRRFCCGHFPQTVELWSVQSITNGRELAKAALKKIEFLHAWRPTLQG